MVRPASQLALLALALTTCSALPLSLAERTPSATTVTYPTANAALISELVLAPSFEDQLAILASDPPSSTNFVYQFVNNTVTPPTGGTIASPSIDEFPALLIANVNSAIGFVNPCSMNTPHIHPHATEFLTLVQGELIAGLVLDEGAGGNGNVVGGPPPQNGGLPVLAQKLDLYQGILFPQGEVHFQYNPSCAPTVFASSFDSRDPGRTQIAQSFFSVTPDELIEANLGDGSVLDASQIDTLRSMIPGAFADVMSECAERCGIGGAKKI